MVGKMFLLWFPLLAASFQCDLADQKTFLTAFHAYLSKFKIDDPMNFDGYRTAIEKIIEDEGWAGSEKICQLVNALNIQLKPIEDCMDTAFASEALQLHPTIVVHYFSNIKQWDYACNEGKDRFQSSFDCIRSYLQPQYCRGDNTNCLGMKQEFLCVLQFYHQNCGDDAAFVLCSMQTVSYYGQNCLSVLDCKDIISVSAGTQQFGAASGNSTDFGHLHHVAAFWFTCRFVLYWLDLN
uniref:Secreted protein n=1 Tax=Panagrolaimus sp. PS1159 TaxID=55785 RepID=A0AC35G0A6_9BILA